MAVPAHKTEYFIIENSNLQKKANTATISAVAYSVTFINALRKMLCKQYLTTFDKVKITGISLIKSVNNNYWLLPQDRIRQC